MDMHQKMAALTVYQQPNVELSMKEAEDFARSIKHKLANKLDLTEEERKKCIQIALRFGDRKRVQAIELNASQPQGSWVKRKMLRDQMAASDRACSPLRARNGNVSKPSRLRIGQVAADNFLSSSPSEIRCA
eukprot:4336065-Pyramimonas_sp.AAC.1